jgi:quinoprotein glucose dehydrogenase
MYWLDADLASRTVADRVAMYKKFFPNSFGQFTATEDRIRRIEDRDGDHRADHATVFADGFSNAEDGLAAGVLARKGDVYLTSIPALWKLRDTKGTGQADDKKILQSGYGVHVAFLGHDLHGLRMGPDGRLYFSIGDRGLHVQTSDGRLVENPDSGAILRCEPDGSKLEIVAIGLRNPQELAFDDHGNLFTIDNNSDSGDQARAVSVVEGGDSGWRVGYQYMEIPTTRGAWNAERLWYPRWQGQAAYIVPPIANISDGPSGFTHEPGVSALPDRYRDHFFLADFRGAHGTSGIRSFAFKPKGATFELVDAEKFAWSLLATDVDFGPDGALYVSDWVDGWLKTGKGRIWRFCDPAKAKDPKIAQVSTLLGEGMEKRSVDALVELLAHADQRVRQEAQFELAERALDENRAAEARAGLWTTATGTQNSHLARLHAIWALGQVGRREAEDSTINVLAKLFKDADPEVRAQSVRVLGDAIAAHEHPEAFNLAGRVIPLLKDHEARVRFFAAQTLGKPRDRAGVKPLVQLLVDNDDKDAYIRHAAVVALASIGDDSLLLKEQGQGRTLSQAGRLGVALALRRMKSASIKTFLSDPSIDVVREAARAIYEVPIPDALPDLAKVDLSPAVAKDEPTLRRIIAANERLGDESAAKRLLALGMDRAVPDGIRVEAFETLAAWGQPTNRDRINGLYRPVPARKVAEAAAAVAPAASDLIAQQPVQVRVAAINALAGVEAKDSGPKLRTVVADKAQLGSVRLAALRALSKLNDPGLSDAVTASVEDRDVRIRSEAHRLLARLEPERAVGTLAKVWKSGTLRERQNVADILGGLKNAKADAILVEALQTLAAGKLGEELELDVREAAEKRRENADIQALLAKLAPAPGDPMAPYRACLKGGNAQKGRQIFQTSTAVECLRCHKIQKKGGEVGPELTGIGQKRNREYLLEAIIQPNKAIAEGFESVVVAKADGTIVSGVFRGEDPTHLRLMTSDGKLVSVAKADIEERKRGPSAMPDDLYKKLSKDEIRDVIEFLSTVR